MADEQQNKNISEDNSSKFDYNKIKKDFNFYIELTNYDLMPKTRKHTNQIINILKNGSFEQTKKYRKQFAVIKTDNNEILVNKKCVLNDMQEVLPLNEYFDVIAEAHLSANHRNLALQTTVSEKYYISFDSIQRFLAMCNVCNPVHDNLQNSPPTEYKVHLSIENFLLDPGCEYHALFYIDESSKYIILRQLKAVSENNIAIELLKIFSDFGVPVIMYIDYILWDIICKALDILSKLSFVLPVISLTQLCKPKELIDASALISKWMRTQNRETWPLTLSCIQFEINTNHKIVNDVATSNYNDFFRVKPKFRRYKFVEKVCDEKDGPKNSICTACSLPICKVYRCQRCAEPFHFTCCKREVIKGSTLNKMILTCFSCNNPKSL